jgi:hypothetical protein
MAWPVAAACGNRRVAWRARPMKLGELEPRDQRVDRGQHLFPAIELFLVAEPATPNARSQFCPQRSKRGRGGLACSEPRKRHATHSHLLDDACVRDLSR